MSHRATVRVIVGLSTKGRMKPPSFTLGILPHLVRSRKNIERSVMVRDGEIAHEPFNEVSYCIGIDSEVVSHAESGLYIP